MVEALILCLVDLSPNELTLTQDALAAPTRRLLLTLRWSSSTKVLLCSLHLLRAPTTSIGSRTLSQASVTSHSNGTMHPHEEAPWLQLGTWTPAKGTSTAQVFQVASHSPSDTFRLTFRFGGFQPFVSELAVLWQCKPQMKQATLQSGLKVAAQ